MFDHDDESDQDKGEFPQIKQSGGIYPFAERKTAIEAEKIYRKIFPVIFYDRADGIDDFIMKNTGDKRLGILIFAGLLFHDEPCRRVLENADLLKAVYGAD